MMRTQKILLTAISVIVLAPASLFAQSAPGAPGAIPTWTSGGKEGVGTSATAQSKVWFTLQGGVMTEVYYPRLDTANVRTLEFAVSDGSTVWLESKDMEHSIEWIDQNALVFRQTSRGPAGNFRITKTYVTDPQRDAVLIDVEFSGPETSSLYLLYDP